MYKPRLLWAVLLFLYAAAIFAFSSFPMTREKPLVPIPHGDKLLHALEFFIFFLLCWKALPLKRKMSTSLILTAIYAGSDEIHQLFVPTRSASLFDWFADLAGGVAAAILIYILAYLPLSRRLRLRILVRPDREKEA